MPQEVLSVRLAPRLMLMLFVLVKVTSSSITITSSVQVGVDTVCNNETVTLTCHTDQQDNITWYWSNQSRRGNNITVLATPYKILYTCMASDNNGTSQKANITIIANGAPPKIVKGNFHNYWYLYEGSDLMLITNITSNLWLSKGSPSWYGFNRNLPKTAKVVSRTVHGTMYSTLNLYNLSYYDDSGEYINSASNRCGDSTVSVFIAVRRRSRYCFNNRVPSLISPPKNYTTVVGEYATFSCLFNGSVTMDNSVSALSSYWAIDYGGTPMIIYGNTTNYHISVYQICSKNERPCCQFISKLMVYNSTVMLNKATVKCYEFLQQPQQSNATVNTKVNYVEAEAKLTIYDLPEVTSGPEDVEAKTSQDVQFTCQFKAPTQADVSIVVWLKDDFAVIRSSSHYNISTTVDPVGENSDHFISMLRIFSITDKDEGKYTCYCYYNTTIVLSTKSHYVRSSLASANLQIKSEESDVQLYASIAAGTIVFVSVLTIWIIGVSFYLRYHRRPQLVNLRENCYDSDDHDEKKLLIDKATQDDYGTTEKTNDPHCHS